MISTMVEAAFRSMLLALAVAAGLRILRVRNVLAQKSAWMLVLAAAIAMPLVQPLAGKWQLLPATASITLPDHPLSRLIAEISALRHRPAAPVAPRHIEPARTLPATQEPVQTFAVTSSTETSSVDLSSPSSYLSSNIYQDAPTRTAPEAPANVRHPLSLIELAWLAYLSVAVTLLLRLFLGLATAVLIWIGGLPVTLRDQPGLAAGLALRASREVSSPVTIGSAVVLSADYADWDTEKLRIVLAHERSHIRQGDFYLQLVAGLYAAIFWFSPLGWWLKSKLSDLAETISDRAGLEQAANCSSYAQILLEFAAAPRQTLTGVAMARPGTLSRRIERLLNDSSFRQAFAGGRSRVLVAILLVPVALFAATSLIRVKAAQDAPAPPPAAPAAQASPAPQTPAAPITGQAAPEPDVNTIAPPTPEAAQAPAPAPAPSVVPDIGPLAPVAPSAALAPVAPVAPSDRIIVVPRVAGRVIVVPDVPRRIVIPEIHAMTIRVPNPAPTIAFARAFADAAKANGYAYYYSDNGESFGIVRGNGEHMQFSGDLHTADIDKIRKMAHGDFLWFNHDGKYYYVDDPATLAKIEAMYKPMELLGKQQEELGRKQEALGKQQEALGEKQEQIAVPTPDLSKEMAQLNAAMATLQAKIGKTITQQELAELQDKLGDLQGRLGDLQGRIGDGMGALGEQQGKLGEEMGRLGAEQGRLGAEQGRISRDADRTVRSIIDESLKNGTARPVQ